jgi:CheY-like chemotaxis protein
MTQPNSSNAQQVGAAGSFSAYAASCDPLLSDPDAGVSDDMDEEVRAMARVFDIPAGEDVPLDQVWRVLRPALDRQLPTDQPGHEVQPAAALTVLVVEDDPDMAATLVESLTDAGHAVFGPVDTAEAAALLAGVASIDVALVDVNLRGKDTGVDLAARLKSTWGVPSIFLSGDVSNVALNAGTSAGYLLKPYRVADVLAALDSFQRRS